MVSSKEIGLLENRRKCREGLKGIAHKAISWTNEHDLDMAKMRYEYKRTFASFHHVRCCAY